MNERKFKLPGTAKPLPGDIPEADAFVAGVERAGQGATAPALSLVPDAVKELPKSFLLKLTHEQAQLIEAGFAALPYKNRKLMVEDILFGELRRRLVK